MIARLLAFLLGERGASRVVYLGGAGVAVSGLIASWIAFGVGGTPNDTACPYPNFPDATCTGVPAGTTLTTPTLDVDGNYNVNTADTVVDGVQVTNCIIVKQPGVTIRNSQARCIYMPDSEPAYNPANDPLTIEDVTVDCTQSAATNPTNSGIIGQNLDAARVNVSDCENGFFIANDTTIRDSFIHNLYNAVASDPHTDGIQVADPGGDRVTIEHNTIYGFSDDALGNWPCGQECNGTSAIIYNNVPAISAADPPVEHVLIRHNLMAGGSVALYCPRQATSDFLVDSNSFSTIYSPNVGEGRVDHTLEALATDCGDDGQSGNVAVTGDGTEIQAVDLP